MAICQPAPGAPTMQIGGHAHVLEEDLAELGVAGHLLERADA